MVSNDKATDSLNTAPVSQHSRSTS